MRHLVSSGLRTTLPAVWHSLKFKQYMSQGEPEIRSLADYVQPDKAAVDAGVHLGFYSRRLQKLASSVYAFEPNPESFRSARRYLTRRTILQQIALSDADGTITLRAPVSGADGGESAFSTCADTNDLGGLPFQSFDVPKRRLDSLGLPTVGFIKIDVEGHEEAVLRGATALIDRDGPTLMIEIEERHNPGGFRRIYDMLAPRGYRAHYLLHQQRVPIAADADLSVLQRPGTGYVNNFIFQREH